jgi:hypothetical protein
MNCCYRGRRWTRRYRRRKLMERREREFRMMRKGDLESGSRYFDDEDSERLD